MGPSLHGICFIICKIFIIVSIVVAGYVIIHVRCQAGVIYNLPVIYPFLLIRSVGYCTAVGRIGQITGIHDKERVNNAAGLRDGPGEIFGILAPVNPDVSIRYDHKPE